MARLVLKDGTVKQYIICILKLVNREMLSMLEYNVSDIMGIMVKRNIPTSKYPK